MISWPDLSVLPPPAKLGDWCVEHFKVSEEDARFTRIRAAATGGREMPVDAGTYAALKHEGQIVMSTTRMERRTNTTFVLRARGRVLIAGLGLGFVLHPVLLKDEVEHVTVVERNQEVIHLVRPSLSAYNKLTIVYGDIHTYEPARGARWDTIYFDIWNTICDDNLVEMRKLRRKFRKNLARGGWIGCWSEDALV